MSNDQRLTCLGRTCRRLAASFVWFCPQRWFCHWSAAMGVDKLSRCRRFVRRWRASGRSVGPTSDPVPPVLDRPPTPFLPLALCCALKCWTAFSLRRRLALRVRIASSTRPDVRRSVALSGRVSHRERPENNRRHSGGTRGYRRHFVSVDAVVDVTANEPAAGPDANGWGSGLRARVVGSLPNT